MFVIRIVVAVLAAALLAGCAVGDTTRDSERIDGTGSVLGGTSTASSGSPTEQATDRALLRAGDLPDGYLTLDRQVLTTSDRYWGDLWGDDGWGDDGCRWLLQGATSPVEPSGHAWGPGRPDVHGAAVFARGALGPYVTHDVATWADAFTAQAAVDEFADLADRCSRWNGDDWTGVRGDINVTRRPAPDGVDDTTALRVHATADAGIAVALTSDVIAVRRGAAVAIVTYTRFDARRDGLRLGPLVAAVAAHLAAVS
jgi:hypothetical protein